MKQTRIMSILEAVLSTVIGFLVALITQILVFPLFGWTPSLVDNLLLTVIFTVVSLIRQYLMRRLFEAMHIRRPLSPFMQAVIAERYRQIESEGWDKQHDDAHKPGDLAAAGAAYALSTTIGSPPNECWPWSLEWWKPAGFRRDLTKSAALIIAEGERFDRTRKRRSSPLVLVASRRSGKKSAP